MSWIVLAVGAGCLAIAGYAVGVVGRHSCPGCGTKLLRSVRWRPDSDPRGATLYKCESCWGEFVRRGKGPFMPRHLWDQGNEGIPPARLLDR